MNVLVTGGNGFLGQYIVRDLLARGYSVSVIGRASQSPWAGLSVDYIQGDLTDKALLTASFKNIDAVFHVAAKAGYWGPWADYYANNVTATQNIIDACLHNNISRLIYTSSPSVVFNGQAIQGANESLPYGHSSICHYAHSKALAEELILKANGQNGLRTIAIRPHLIWGVGDRHIVPRIIEQAKKGKLCIVGNGQNLVDITHVRNASHAHLLALDAISQNKVTGKAYFISQGTPVKIWDWAASILKGLNIPLPKKQISFKMAYGIGYGLEMVYKLLKLKSEPRMTRFLATELAKNHYFDTSAAAKDLGYGPIVSIEQGLAELIQHYRAS